MRDEADLFVKEGQISPMRPTDKKYQLCVQQMKELAPFQSPSVEALCIS